MRGVGGKLRRKCREEPMDISVMTLDRSANPGGWLNAILGGLLGASRGECLGDRCRAHLLHFMAELIRFSKRRGNRPKHPENACVQFRSCRVLGDYSGLDVSRGRAQGQTGGDRQLSAEIEVGLSAFKVIVKVAALGDYLVNQQVPLIGWSVKLGNLYQMVEDLVLNAGQSVGDGPAERVGDGNVRIWGRSGWQLRCLGLERGQPAGDGSGPVLGYLGVAG